MFLSSEQLTNLLLEGLRLPLRRFSRSSATAKAFALEPERIPSHVLLRHLAEHVMRIRMFRPLDAGATKLLSERQSDVVDLWKRYARSEAVHDRYFLRDLAAAGIPREAVEALEPFSATQRLGRFVDLAMEEYGPLPVVLYSFWAEQNSETGSTGVHARTKALFGTDATRGAVAHRALDDGQGHPALIARVIADLVRDADELLLATQLLEQLTLLLQEYFSELDEWGEGAGADCFRVFPRASVQGEVAVAA